MVADGDGEVLDRLSMLSSRFGVLSSGDGSGGNEGGKEEEGLEVFPGSKLDAEVEKLDRDGGRCSETRATAARSLWGR